MPKGGLVGNSGQVTLNGNRCRGGQQKGLHRSSTMAYYATTTDTHCKTEATSTTGDQAEQAI